MASPAGLHPTFRGPDRRRGAGQWPLGVVATSDSVPLNILEPPVYPVAQFFECSPPSPPVAAQLPLTTALLRWRACWAGRKCRCRR